jgi:serine/threonine-protein kinase
VSAAIHPSPPTRYRPLVKIGSGGMATVHAGVETDSETLVAIKRPHQHLIDDPGFHKSLLGEAKVASALDHPNVVRVRDIEHLEDCVQLVMDYVEGATLGELLVHASRGGPSLPPRVAVRIVLDACAGLAALHELRDQRSGSALGFVHRDVSPQNILVGRDGRARITDFGLAKCSATSEQTTTQGTLKGKLGYLAPEVVRGARADHGADVFAAGVVFWEALAEKRLFRGSNDADTIERVVRAAIPKLDDRVPEAVARVLERALERDPAARFANAKELEAALSVAAEESGFVATPSQVAAHVEEAFGALLEQRRSEIARALGTPSAGHPAPRRRPRRWWLALAVFAVTLGAWRFLTEPAPPKVEAAPPAAEVAATAAPPDPGPPPATLPVIESAPAVRARPAPRLRQRVVRGDRERGLVKPPPPNPYR